MKKLILKFIPALRAISAHKMQSVFSCVGILFGIAFLINFFAIHRGYDDYLLQQKSVSGTDNILITPLVPISQPVTYTKEDSFRLSHGLNSDDVESIKNLFPQITAVCSDISFDANVSYELIHRQVKMSGVCENYFKIFNNKITEGQAFMPIHYNFAKPVCIISSDLKRNLFANKNPIGKWIKCNDLYLKVIGIIQVNKDIIIPEELKVLGSNNVVYAPLQTIKTRYRFVSTQEPPSISGKAGTHDSYHTPEKIIVHFNNSDKIDQAPDIINRLLLRRHNEVRDFKIIVPEHILKKETVKQRIAMISILIISFICLFIGGISIMNYMYSVYHEKLKSYKLQLSNGIPRSDIILQFLAQGTIVSFAGGLLGIIVGIIFSKLFFNATKITTIVPFSSIIISFVVSICVGIIFSYIPVRKLTKD